MIDGGVSAARRQQVAARPNPQTGPFHVEGAEPGDTLVLGRNNASCGKN
jgi:acetamidase/formamidase